MKERILARVRLRECHCPTGATKHYSMGGLLPAPAELKISQYEGDSGFLLLYLDAVGNEMTDTWHETLQKAKEQAAFEFNVSDADWE